MIISLIITLTTCVIGVPAILGHQVVDQKFILDSGEEISIFSVCILVNGELLPHYELLVKDSRPRLKDGKVGTHDLLPESRDSLLPHDVLYDSYRRFGDAVEEEETKADAISSIASFKLG